MANNKNIGVFTNPKHELYVADIETPRAEQLGEEDVLVHVKSTGICGSDIHFQKHGQIGPTMVVRDEHILGHESAGEVKAVGSKVHELKVGDKVALEPGVPCQRCSNCLKGRYNGCEMVEFSSTPPVAGFLRRYIKHPARFCHKINSLNFEQGALLEPLSVVFSGIRHTGLLLGDTILICGAGPIGFVAAKCAEAAGAETIVITDVEQSRLDFIKLRVPRVKTVRVGRSMEENIKNLNKVQVGYNVCFECTGVEPSIELATNVLVFGGKLHIIGVGKEYQQIPFMVLSVKEIAVTFQYRYANTWPTAIKLAENGIVNLDSVITHRFSLEEAKKAFETASDPRSGAMKIMIVDD